MIPPSPFLNRRVKGSYFAECERDDDGHCLPSGQTEEKRPERRRTVEEPAKPEPKGDDASAEKAKQEYKELGTKAPAFKAWFGDFENDPENASKAVDEDGKPAKTLPFSRTLDDKGKPRILFHGRNRKFDTFKEGESPGVVGFFSASADYASAYGDRVDSFYLNLRNPLDLSEQREGDSDYSQSGRSVKRKVSEWLEIMRKQGVDTSRIDLGEEVEPGDRVAYWGLLDAAAGIVSKQSNLIAELRRQGFDGIVGREGEGNDLAYAAFASTQIKAVDNAGTFDPADANITKSLAPRIPPSPFAYARTLERREKKFTRSRGQDGRERCFQDGTPVPCQQGQDAEEQPKPAQEEEKQADPQFAEEWAQVVESEMDGGANVAQREYTAQEVAAEQDWHAQLIGWRQQAPDAPLAPEDAGKVGRFASGLLNAAVGGAEYISGLLSTFKIQPSGDNAAAEIQAVFDKASPETQGVNAQAAKLLDGLFGKLAVPVVQALFGGGSGGAYTGGGETMGGEEPSKESKPKKEPKQPRAPSGEEESDTDKPKKAELEAVQQDDDAVVSQAPLMVQRRMERDPEFKERYLDIQRRRGVGKNRAVKKEQRLNQMTPDQRAAKAKAAAEKLAARREKQEERSRRFWERREGKAMSALNETSGGALVPPSPFAARRFKMFPYFAKDKQSYFGTCPRDDEGHCKPSGQGDDPKKQKPSKEAESSFEKAPARRGKMTRARRIGKGKNAKIVLAGGKAAPAHIKPGMVPPDWSDVQVSLDPKADLLVTARDGKGRPKAVYTDAFHVRNAAVKFARVDEMIRKSAEIDAQIQQARSDPSTKDAADCAWLMSEQATRPGSDKDTGAENKAYGATTLEGRHVVKAKDGIRLRFIGKEGVAHDHLVRDPKLAQMLVARAKAAGGKGRLFDTNEGKVNSFIGTLDGGHFSAKDFRTRRANLLAVAAMKKWTDPPGDEKEYKSRVKQVAEAVSHVLGNKPQQCLESYLNPVIFSPWRVAGA